MYEAFFGLDRAPFSLTPDTARFVSLDSHSACFEVLRRAIDSNEGFVKIVGDVGTGKTLLSRKLLHYLQGDTRFLPIYIPNPMLSALGLMRAIASALNVDNASTLSHADLFEQIQSCLLAESDSERAAVIIIDEAQALPEDTLEALRLITNLETETRKLVQIVLFGQPELDVVLNQHRFRQLRQRIAFHARLDPMGAGHVGHYVQARLQASGYKGSPVFTPGALKRLYRHSRGVPRMLNILCHKALLSAYGRGQMLVTPRDIRRAAADTPAAFGLRTSLRLPLAATGLGLVALIGWQGSPLLQPYWPTSQSEPLVTAAALPVDTLPEPVSEDAPPAQDAMPDLGFAVEPLPTVDPVPEAEAETPEPAESEPVADTPDDTNASETANTATAEPAIARVAAAVSDDSQTEVPSLADLPNLSPPEAPVETEAQEPETVTANSRVNFSSTDRQQLLQQASQYHRAGDTDTALTLLRERLRADDHTDVRQLYARLLLRTGDVETARHVVRPGHNRQELELRAYADYQAGAYTDATRHYEELLRRTDTPQQEWYLWLAICHDHLQADQQAIFYYETYLSQIRDQPESLIRYARERLQQLSG